MPGEPRYIELDDTVFRVWNDGTNSELLPGEQALFYQLQAAQAERDELQRERDALREALEDLHLSADFSFDDAGSMELVTYSRPAYLWRNLKHALRASTPSEDG